MAGFDGPAPQALEEREKEKASPENTRYGLILFAIYVVFYAGFMYLNAFQRDLMASTPLFGLNLAILYGFGLIAGALVLALIYAYLCREVARASLPVSGEIPRAGTPVPPG